MTTGLMYFYNYFHEFTSHQSVAQQAVVYIICDT
jgi:hypothetical protein